MKAKDVMTHCLVSIPPDAPIRDAIARMISHQVSGMPVVDTNGKLLGMVTEGDFLRRAEMRTQAPRKRWLELLMGPGWEAGDYVRSHGLVVRDVMSPNTVAVGTDTPLADVVNLMEEHAIKRIPVVDAGRVVGIVSRADLMTALGTYLMKPKKTARASDDEIRRSIVSEMKKQPWCPAHSVDIRVRNGVVTIKGTIFDERQRRAIQVLAENIDGVKGVHDHLGEYLGGRSAPAPSGGRIPKPASSAARRSP
jgi:CBS domain-containing protein